MKTSLLLRGLDGSNPLAFLASLGVLRVVSLQSPAAAWRMHWSELAGSWFPLLTSAAETVDETALVDRLDGFQSDPPQLSLLEQIGPNLTISGQRLRHLSQQAMQQCCQGSTGETLARLDADFLAAMGCDAATADGDPQSQMRDTALRTMSGAGHQHFVAFMRELIGATEPRHLRSALFSTWDYADPGRGLNMRWDPADDRRYALRWKNPSADPNTTMRGANRLAIEALPLFTTAPTARGLETTGFSQRPRQGARWTWPIWDRPIDVETVRSLLQLPEIQPPAGRATEAQQSRWRQAVAARGVVVLFQSRRITTGKFRNFTPAVAL